jgi:3-hydroxybutyryl-CoA dehydrogenase
MHTIGVVGAGLMGAGIAEVCARAGLDVVVAEAGDDAVAAGTKRIDTSLARAVKADKLTADDATAARDRMSFTTDYARFEDRDLVVEAVAEIEAIKLDVFERLDAVVGTEAILGSNTSSIPIAKLAMATQHPERVIGLHFFNPVPVMTLVELTPSLMTSPETEQRCRTFVEESLAKTVIKAQDRAGFIVNALLVPFLLSAIRMLESGFATAEDIDTGMVRGCAHPMGPLRLTDLVGLDTTRSIADSLYDEYKEPLYAPPPLLVRMVEAGRLGRKSGRGFFEYDG